MVYFFNGSIFRIGFFETIRKPCGVKAGPPIQRYAWTVGFRDGVLAMVEPRRSGSIAIVKIPKLSFCRYPVVSEVPFSFFSPREKKIACPHR